VQTNFAARFVGHPLRLVERAGYRTATQQGFETMAATETHALWTVLETLPQPALTELFADPARMDRYASVLDLPGGPIRFDWAKTHLSPEVEAVLGQIASAVDLPARRAALFAGETINNTEGRAATHCAERGIGNPAAADEAAMFHERMRALVEAIHEGLLGEIKSLIHIGIGGSALGPALAIDALAREDARVAVHVEHRWRCARGRREAMRPRNHADRGRFENLHHHRNAGQCRECA
jgi:hypothetical protein